MKVSIITPSFNQDKYIGQCVESVLFQSYQNLEHIIIDNLSTDNTRKVLSNYSHDKRLKVISERDKGQSDAVNKGVAFSKGDIIIWLNSDDFLSSVQVVEKVVEIFQSDDKLDAVYGGVTFFNQGSNWMRYVPPLPMVYDMFRYIAFIGNSNIFLKRKILKKNKVSLNLHYVVDHEWLLRVFKGKMRYKRIPLSITNFRRHEDAKSSVYDPSFKAEEGKVRDQTSGKRKYFNSVFLALYRCVFFTLTINGRFITKWN